MRIARARGDWKEAETRLLRNRRIRSSYITKSDLFSQAEKPRVLAERRRKCRLLRCQIQLVTPQRRYLLRLSLFFVLFCFFTFYNKLDDIFLYEKHIT